MDAISNDEIREVVVQKSARVGYTKILLAAVGYNAEHRRRNQALWQPTDDDATEFTKTDLDPMLRDVKALRAVLPRVLSRDRDNTLRAKHFLGSMLHIRGGKAAKNYRRLSVDVAMLDELDGFDADIEKEGSPVTLAAKRVEGATFPKLVLGSTPKLKHLSLIEARFQQAERRFRYHVPCPHCGHLHALTWGGKAAAHGMKWQDDPESVAQLCPGCGALYRQGDYLAVWGLGRWVDERGGWIDPEGKFRDGDGHLVPAPRSIAFHVWTAYSPMTTWSQIVREWQAAQAKAKQGDKGELKSFINTTLGETWEEEIEQADQHELLKRAEDRPLRACPAGVLILTAGVDVQDRRFEVTVWGWGRGEESWTVDHTVLEADPASAEDWNRLDAYLQTRFPHAGGQTLAIEAAAIDTGGHFTHQAYQFVRMRTHRRIYAVKGDAQQGKPIKGRSSLQDVNFRGAVIKRGVRLWLVGTDTAKDVLFGRLKIRNPGPGHVHLTKAVGGEWFEQLTAEARVLQRTSTGDAWRWVKRGPRNEALDCAVYALFAAHMLDLHRYTDAMWHRLEQRVAPVQGDLLAAPADESEPGEPSAPDEAAAPSTRPEAAPRRGAPPRRGGWLQSWKQ